MKSIKHKQMFIFLAIFIVGVCLAFVLGRASQIPPKNTEAFLNSSGVRFISSQDLKTKAEKRVSAEDMKIRASSRGTKYYFPWCTSTFNEANTIYFSSPEEAEGQGLTLASNCIPQQD